jgi:branched-chain amino acid transport system substrate-binding protein
MSSESKTGKNSKKLFIIAPIGSEESDTRKRSDKVKKHIIDPIANEYNYDTFRSDKIYQPGLIPDQIIRHLEEDDLVIADLTDQNPNVFYELAIRQICGSPVILLCLEEQKTPFDVSAQRIIFYDHKDWDSLAETKDFVTKTIGQLESGEYIYESPIKLKKFENVINLNEEIAALRKYIEELNRRLILYDEERMNKERQISLLNNKLSKIQVKKRFLEGETIRIGYISSSTSGLETSLPLIKNIIEPDINRYAEKLGYNLKFELLIDDARGQATIHLEKVQSYNSLGVKLIIGGEWSSQASSSLAYCNENNILLFSPSSTSSLLSMSNDNLFRMCPTDEKQGEAIAEMLWGYGIKEIILLQRSDVWADSIYKVLETAYTNKGGKILDRIRYSIDTTDYSVLLQNIESTIRKNMRAKNSMNITGIQVISFNEITSIAKQAQEYPLIYDLPWFGTDGTALLQNLLTDAPTQAEHIKLFSTLPAAPESIKYKNLSKRYFSLTSRPLGYYSACMYDIAWVIARAVLEAQSSDPSVIISLIPNICENQFGVSGWCLLDEFGDRAFSNYQIWGYGRIDNGPIQNINYGSYDCITQKVQWNKEY